MIQHAVAGLLVCQEFLVFQLGFDEGVLEQIRV